MFERPWLLAVCLLVSSAPVRAAEPFHYPVGQAATGELRYLNGVPVLTVAGNPEEIGDAVGKLALLPGQRMASYADDCLQHYHVSLLRPSFVSAGRKMVQRFPADHQREFEAMVRAAEVDRDQAVLGNTLFDLKKILACSALLVEPGRSATGTPLLGRNLDYPSLGYAYQYSLVTVYRPTGKHAFASVGFPGLVGCLSGMNDAGLALAVLEVFHVKAGHARFKTTGLPYAICYRRLLEECTTIAEAKALLESMPRTTITNLVLADREGVAVFEVTPTQVQVRRGDGGAVICTNHFCTEELATHWTYNSYRTHDRFKAIEAATRPHKKIGLAELHEAMEASHQEGETMQTMAFEPAALRMYLSIGTCPSTAGEMKRLDLEALLRPEDAKGQR